MTEKFRVVISGISGRFPECSDVDTFKEKLYAGYDFVTTDNRKWPVGYKHKMVGEKLIPDPTGKLPDNHKKFDFTVFKLSRLWALGYDILNRIILEPSFEAIVDAGINPYSLDGSNVGVFMSSCCNEVESSIMKNEYGSSLAILGTNKAMLSNRVSYALNLTGTSITNHADVHGGLESLAMAYKYVSQGLCEGAIVGAASSILDPRVSLQYFSLGVLSPDGITRPFDEWANGYARSECVVCFYLQRAEDAKRNYGEIKFCDFSYSGSILPSLIGYNEEYLEKTWHRLLQEDNFTFDPSAIAFVEMNAFGHEHTDKIESNAVAELFSKNKRSPLMVGSVKSNVGQTEAVAGLISVLKALFALDSGTVAPNINLKNTNKNIKAFEQNRLKIVTESTSLPGSAIAINSFGLSGSVGMAIIEQNENATRVQLHEDVVPRILLICGREKEELLIKLKQIQELPYNSEFVALANESFRQNMPHHAFRGYTLLPPPPGLTPSVGDRGEINRPVWFIFSGMGSQWCGMGKDLLNLPLFAETVAKCDRVLKTKNIDIYNILTCDDPTMFDDDITNAFVGIITVQIGLCEILKSLGIEPNGMVGHSVGENACAYADGCLTLEEAVLASWARGKASKIVKTIRGMMAAVGKSYVGIKDTLPDDIQVACHNSKDSCTLTGPAESVIAYVTKLKEEGVFAKAVSVGNIAYHSKYIVSVGTELLRILSPIIKEPKKRSSKWISTSIPKTEWHTSLAQYCSAEYATNNLLSPVLFEEGCAHIPVNAVCIEIAPHGLLQAILKRSLPSTNTNIPLTSWAKNKNSLNFLLSAIGDLYIAGLEPRVNNIFPNVEYPVSRGTPSLSPYCTWYHGEGFFQRHVNPHYKEDLPASSERIPICIRNDSDDFYLKEHRIDDKISIPISFFMHLTWKAFCFVRTEELYSSSIVFDNVKVHDNVIMKIQDVKYASVMIQYGSGNFEVILRDQENSRNFRIILTGSINVLPESTQGSSHLSANHDGDLITKLHFYDVFKRAGYSLGEYFLVVNDLRHHDTEYRTNVMWNGNWIVFLDALMKVQMFADHEKNIRHTLPSRIRRLEISAPKFLSLKKGTTLPCTIDVATREIYCAGVRMSDLKYESLPSTPEKQFNEFRFVPYQNPQCQNIYEFLNLSLQIAIESQDCLSKLAVVDFTKRYLKIIEQIIDEQSFLESVVVLHSPKDFSHASGYILIITDEVEELAALDALTTKFSILVLVVSPSGLTPHDTKHCFVEITKQTFSANTFTLLKRAPLYLFENRGTELKSKINGKIEETDPYVVVHNNIEFEDVSRLVRIKRKNHSNTRHLFIMDEVKNNETLNELLQKQKIMDLPVLIYKYGKWGSYRNLSRSDSYKSEYRESANEQHPLSRVWSDTMKVHYIYVPSHNSQDASTKQVFYIKSDTYTCSKPFCYATTRR